MSRRKSKTWKEYVQPTEPINAKASQGFGLRVADFLYYDIKTILKSDDVGSSHHLKHDCQGTEDERSKCSECQPDSITTRNRAIAHANLVKSQGEQLRRREKEQYPLVKQPITKLFKTKKPPGSKKLEEPTNPPFKFTHLPPEIQEMILTHHFSSRSSRKQSLLAALHAYGDLALHATAKRIWCQQSDFQYTLEYTRANELMDTFDQEHMDYVRRATIVISKTISLSLSGTFSILRARHLSQLTLNIFSNLGFNKAIDSVVGRFRSLRVVRARVYRCKHDSLPAYLRVKEALDGTLGLEGKVEEKSAAVVVWLWDLRGVGAGMGDGEKARKVFTPRVGVKHIKFCE